MKLVTSLILILSCLHGAISEFKSDDYQILIGKNFDDEAIGIIEDYDQSISIVGYTQDYKTNTQPSKSYTSAFEYLQATQDHHGEQLRLIKLNKKAEIQLDKSFKLEQYNRATSIIKTVNNGYVLGGYSYGGKMMISSLDTNANENYLQLFGTANFDQLHALIPLRDGSNIAIGTSQTSRDNHDNMFVQGLGRSDVYLVKFRPDGQIRWRKKYGSTKRDIGIDGVATGDGGFILLAASQEAEKFQVVAVKINDTGDTAWIKKFPKEGRQKAFKVIKTTKGNYLISATFENKNGQDNIRLIKIDNEGNVIWERNYFNNATEHLNSIAIDLKGNIIGVGYSQSAGQSDMDALVRYFDDEGNLVWERKYGKHRQESFKCVTLLHDNTFAIAGFSNSFADKGRQIWVLKLHDDGSMVKKHMKKYKGLYEALKTAFKDNPQVHVYKDLRITHDGLIFKQGSSTLSKTHKSVLEPFIPSLLKVISHYKNDIKDLRINGYTSTEWNAPDTQRYLNNARLSNDRAMHILDYSYQLDSVKKYQNWISQILSTDGYSYSNLIYANKKENMIRSRRVEFEIELK